MYKIDVFGLLFSEIWVFINIMAFSTREGVGDWRLSFVPFPLHPPLPTFPIPAIVRG